MSRLREPFLVAAWPGMGAVALIAANHLVRTLGARRLSEIAGGEHFHPRAVEVRRGIMLPPRVPRTVLWGWSHPHAGRDLVILIGEEQPSSSSWRYCETVLDAAQELGVVRAFTFAAMATPASPTAPARVFAAASDAAALSDVQRLGAEPIDAGEIGGLNGVFLPAAAERRLPGTCLLGEVPYYASAVANPKAAAAVLRVFARLADVPIDLTELEQAGAEVERQLAQHLERLEKAARSIKKQPAQAEFGPEPGGAPEQARERDLAEEDVARIEALFAGAEQDRSRALALKAELDRLGVFERYEDRFLDLFRHAD